MSENLHETDFCDIQVEPIVLSETSAYQIECQFLQHNDWFPDPYFSCQRTKQDAEALISSLDDNTRARVRYRVIEIKTTRLLI